MPVANQEGSGNGEEVANTYQTFLLAEVCSAFVKQKVCALMYSCSLCLLDDRVRKSRLVECCSKKRKEGKVKERGKY